MQHARTLRESESEIGLWKSRSHAEVLARKDATLFQPLIAAKEGKSKLLDASSAAVIACVSAVY